MSSITKRSRRPTPESISSDISDSPRSTLQPTITSARFRPRVDSSSRSPHKRARIGDVRGREVEPILISSDTNKEDEDEDSSSDTSNSSDDTDGASSYCTARSPSVVYVRTPTPEPINPYESRETRTRQNARRLKRRGVVYPGSKTPQTESDTDEDDENRDALYRSYERDDPDIIVRTSPLLGFGFQSHTFFTSDRTPLRMASEPPIQVYDDHTSLMGAVENLINEVEKSTGRGANQNDRPGHVSAALNTATSSHPSHLLRPDQSSQSTIIPLDLDAHIDIRATPEERERRSISPMIRPATPPPPSEGFEEIRLRSPSPDTVVHRRSGNPILPLPLLVRPPTPPYDPSLVFRRWDSTKDGNPATSSSEIQPSPKVTNGQPTPPAGQAMGPRQSRSPTSIPLDENTPSARPSLEERLAALNAHLKAKELAKQKEPAVEAPRSLKDRIGSRAASDAVPESPMTADTGAGSSKIPLMERSHDRKPTLIHRFAGSSPEGESTLQTPLAPMTEVENIPRIFVEGDASRRSVVEAKELSKRDNTPAALDVISRMTTLLCYELQSKSSRCLKDTEVYLVQDLEPHKKHIQRLVDILGGAFLPTHKSQLATPATRSRRFIVVPTKNDIPSSGVRGGPSVRHVHMLQFLDIVIQRRKEEDAPRQPKLSTVTMSNDSSIPQKSNRSSSLATLPPRPQPTKHVSITGNTPSVISGLSAIISDRANAAKLPVDDNKVKAPMTNVLDGNTAHGTTQGRMSPVAASKRSLRERMG